MAARESFDLRKLKDSAAEFLKKSKFDKAAEVLELLVRAEPREMSNRLRLGDTYRKLDQKPKAISAYQAVAKVFADEGQLIKAIGAIKVILEIDPSNQMAQRELEEMNTRRFARPTLELGGGKKPAAPRSEAFELEGPGGQTRVVDAGRLDGAADESVPLDDELPPARGPRGAQRGDAADSSEVRVRAHSSAGQGREGVPEIEFDDDTGETLELLDERPARGLRRPAAAAPTTNRPTPARSAPPRGPEAKAPPAVTPPPPREKLLSLDPDLPPVHHEPLPEDLAAAADDETVDAEEITEADIEAALATRDEPEVAAPVAPPQPRRVPVPPPPPAPIADLLTGEAEEEIELLSVSSEEERGEEGQLGADLDQAFGAIAPAATSAPARKIPARVPLLDDLPRDAFVELVNKLEYRRHAPGEVILREGDPGRSFFIIVGGQVRISKTQPGGEELPLATLGEGAFFGEMALLSGAPRAASVAAEEETDLLEVTDVVLRDLARKYPHVIRNLKDFYRQRLLNNVMAISPLFRDFNPGERKQIVERFKMRQATVGQVVIQEGTPSDGLYVVLHGSVGVTKSTDQPLELATLREGDIFGEMSLLTREPATATVTAASSSILLKLPRENFQELILTHPQILELVSQLTEQRRTATEAIVAGHGSFV